MTDVAQKEELAQARATASQIRQGIHNYLATLALIARANKERHWKVLGYASWEAYVDAEFGADRLRLPPEHRQKAIAELRLSGMSVRAIGHMVGMPKSSVADELAQLSEGGQSVQPERVISRDGRDRPATQPKPAEVDPTPGEGCGSTSAPSRPDASRGHADARLDAPAPASGVREADDLARSSAGDGTGALSPQFGAPVPTTAVGQGPGPADADGEGAEGAPDRAAAASPPAGPPAGGEVSPNRCPVCGGTLAALEAVGGTQPLAA